MKILQRKCDYCYKKYKRRDLRVKLGTDILLDVVCCEGCANKHKFIWIK